jgi:hypothetical protein
LVREFHLSPPGKGRGLSCDTEGAFVGAIPILDRLRKNGRDEWRPRNCEELSDEIGEHYGLPIDMSSKTGGLTAIANALNEGDVARAQIATVLLGIPDPPQLSKGVRSREQMIKLIRDLHWSGLLKWDPDQHPRWPAESSDSKGGEFAPKGEGGETAASPRSQPRAGDRSSSYNFESDRAHRSARIQLVDADNVVSDASDSPLAEAIRAAAAERRSAGIPLADGFRSDVFVDRSAEELRAAVAEAARERDRDAPSLQRHFEQKYDDLGPVDFSKQVIQFGYWLEMHGKGLSPAAKQRALAEYDFVQGRLSFWLAYDYKSFAAYRNLVSAADLLYQGAINGRIVEVGQVPPSMEAVLGEAWGLEGGQLPIARAPVLRPVVPEENVEGIEGHGLSVNNGDSGIAWGYPIEEQGRPWEVYGARQNPNARRLPEGSKAFDRFDKDSGEAISDKTLNTQTFSSIQKPQQIYNRVQRYINAAANYKKPRAYFDLDPALIKSKTLQLAVPEYTSPAQWRQLHRAILYGRTKRIRVVITRIRE